MQTLCEFGRADRPYGGRGWHSIAPPGLEAMMPDSQDGVRSRKLVLG